MPARCVAKLTICQRVLRSCLRRYPASTLYPGSLLLTLRLSSLSITHCLAVKLLAKESSRWLTAQIQKLDATRTVPFWNQPATTYEELAHLTEIRSRPRLGVVLPISIPDVTSYWYNGQHDCKHA